MGHIALVDPDASKFKSKTCQGSLTRFAANASRAISLGILPGSAFYMGAQWIACGEIAKWNTVGKQVAPGKGSRWRHPSRAQIEKNAQLIGQRAHSLMLQFMSQMTPTAMRDELEKNTKMFELFNSLGGQYLHEMLENGLRSVAVESWGCVEVLTEQLYQGAAKENPTKFAQLSQNQEKGIGFGSLKRTKVSFALGFKGETTITDPLKDKAFSALSLLRNVIVHSSGKTDQDFLDGIQCKKDHDPGAWLDPFKNHQIDDPVEIDGEIVRSLVDLIFKRCYELIEAVDAWI